jgi:arylsulfate sulfotransferase
VARTPASQIMEVTHTNHPQTVWQLNLTGENAYRGYRIPSLYPGITWEK